MERNILLEMVVQMSRPEEYHAHYYQTEPIPPIRMDKTEDRFRINGIREKMRTDAHSDAFGFQEYGELVKDAYIKHLELELKLTRGEWRGPTRLQSGNWAYTQELNPGVFLGFDLDVVKNYLGIDVLTIPGNPLRDKIMAETHNFMKLVGIPQQEMPKRTPEY